jgi:hypothetical protein
MVAAGVETVPVSGKVDRMNTCTCGHEKVAHRKRGCVDNDSYGMGCTCPSFEAEPDDMDELDQVDDEIRRNRELHVHYGGIR